MWKIPYLQNKCIIMRSKINHILFLLFLVLFSFVKVQSQNNRKNTEFSETCLKISSDFEKQGDHGYIFNNKTKKYLSLPEFSKILKKISKYDLDKNKEYKIEENDLGRIKKVIWKDTTKGSKLLYFKKLTFKTIIEQEFFGEKFKNEFEIIDYEIIRTEKPKKICLRILVNEFEEITIDDVRYNGVFESRILGADEAEMEFNKLLK